MRSLAKLTKLYRGLSEPYSQPIHMCVGYINSDKPFEVIGKGYLGGYEVRYPSTEGYWYTGYLDRNMFTYLSSKAKKRTGKRKRKLKQRKGTPRKGRK